MARRAYEGMAGQIFPVARLFTHQHEPGGGWAFSEDRLGGVFSDRAIAAPLRTLAQLIYIGIRRKAIGFTCVGSAGHVALEAGYWEMPALQAMRVPACG